MNKLNPKVDKYLLEGCMRCKFGGTAACKVNNWRTELEMLRQIAMECGLTEELKWSFPCYTDHGKNILMVSAFKEYACMSFLKGALLKDDQHILQKHGENSQSYRIIKFTKAEQISKQEANIRKYIAEAVQNERAGKKVEFSRSPFPLPDELLQKFEEYPGLKRAFYTLTAGRQRAYVHYFSQPKQTTTRIKRIEKYKLKILNGEGLIDKYRH